MANIHTLTTIVYAKPENYPLKGYIYGADGYHSGSIWIEDEVGFKEFLETRVKYNIDSKLEVRITNTLDEMVFHSKNGEILYPKEKELENGNKL